MECDTRQNENIHVFSNWLINVRWSRLTCVPFVHVPAARPIYQMALHIFLRWVKLDALSEANWFAVTSTLGQQKSIYIFFRYIDAKITAYKCNLAVKAILNLTIIAANIWWQLILPYWNLKEFRILSKVYFQFKIDSQFLKEKKNYYCNYYMNSCKE